MNSQNIRFARIVSRTTLVAVIALAVLCGASFAYAQEVPPVESPIEEGVVTLSVQMCHGTGMNENPYTVEHPATIVDVDGHDGHAGPVWYQGITETWGDIIPPFLAGDVSYPGMNWTTEGQAIWQNECQVVVEEVLVEEEVVEENVVVEEDVVTDPETTEKCEIEGHKYDEEGTPLSGWEIGLMKIRMFADREESYDLVDDMTESDGYYCLEWDGISGLPENTDEEYSFVYHVYEVLKEGWNILGIAKGTEADVVNNTLANVPENAIRFDGDRVGTHVFDVNGFLPADTAYHVDFYNTQDGEDNGGGEETLACTLTSDKTTVGEGESFTLSWTTTLAGVVTLDSVTVDPQGSTTLESITGETTYTLIATQEGEGEDLPTATCTATISRTTDGGGNNGNSSSSSGRRQGSKGSGDTDGPSTPEGEVLGATTDTLPVGAPDTGFGGTSASPLSSMIALFGMLASVFVMRKARHG